MKNTKVSHAYLALLLACSVTLAQQRKPTGYSCDTNLVFVQYSDSAVGELRAKANHAAKNVHTES